MSPEISNNFDIVGTVVDTFQQRVASLRSVAAPAPLPSEPDVTGVVDLAQHTKNKSERELIQQTHDREEREFEEAQTRLLGLNDQVVGEYDDAKQMREAVNAEKRVKVSGKKDEKSARVDGQIKEISKKTATLVKGVEMGVVKLEHISDAPLREFAKQTLSIIVEKNRKLLHPDVIMHTLPIIDLIYRGDVTMDSLSEAFVQLKGGEFGKYNPSLIKDLSTLLQNRLAAVAESDIAEFAGSAMSREDFEQYVKDEFDPSMPDMASQDLLKSIVDTAQTAQILMDNPRARGGEELVDTIQSVLRLAQSGELKLDHIEDLTKKTYALHVLKNFEHISSVFDDPQLAAHFFPIVQALVNGNVQLEQLYEAYLPLAKRYGFDHEEFATIIQDGIKEGFSIVPQDDLAKFTMDASAAVDYMAFNERLNQMLDYQALTPYSVLEQQGGTYGAIMEYFTEHDDKKLLRAIFDADTHLEGYLGEMHERLVSVEREKLLSENPDLTQEELDENIKNTAERRSQHISLEFKDNVLLLTEKLFKGVDELAPSEYWGEATEKGDMFSSTNNLFATFQKKLERIKSIRYSTNSVVDELSWTYRGSEYERYKDVVTQGGQVTRERQQFSSTYKQFIPLQDSAEYFEILLKSVKAVEGIKRFMHDARTSLMKPAGEHGYLAQLKGFTDSQMGSLEFDSMYELPDTDEMLQASQIWEAMARIDLADDNWILRPSGDLDHETGVPRADKLTLSYLSQMSGLESWRARQAVALGAGQHFSGMSLSGIMMYASAFAPTDISEGAPNQFLSYGLRDSDVLTEVDPFIKGAFRWRASGMDVGLLMTPVAKIKKDGQIEWLVRNGFDNEDLMEAWGRYEKAIMGGKAHEDVGIIRAIDIWNPGKIGGADDRKGWRDMAALDHWFADEKNGMKDLGTLDKLKSVELVGVEAMKWVMGEKMSGPDMFGNVGGKDAKTYEDAQATQNARYEVFNYLYEKYFVKPPQISDFGHIPDESERTRLFKQAQSSYNDVKSEKFSDIEGLKRMGKGEKKTLKALKHEYKTFYDQTMARAYLQRCPTLLLTTEKNADVSGRTRIWDVVKKDVSQISPMSDAEYKIAVQDIAAIEAQNRADVSRKFWDDFQESENKWAHHLTDEIVYELNPNNVASYLNDMSVKGVFGTHGDASSVDRVKRAQLVYEQMIQTMTSLDVVNDAGVEQKFVDAFAFKNGLPWPAGFQRAIGNAELDRRGLAYRRGGNRIPARAFGDAAASAENITKKMSHSLGVFKKVRGMEDRREGDELIATEVALPMFSQAVGMHGKEHGYMLSAIVLKMAANNTRRDDAMTHSLRPALDYMARASLGKSGGRFAGRYGSYAERVSGTHTLRGVRVDAAQHTRDLLEVFASPEKGLLPHSPYEGDVKHAKMEYDEKLGREVRVENYSAVNFEVMAKDLAATPEDVAKSYLKWVTLGGVGLGIWFAYLSLKSQLKKEAKR